MLTITADNLRDRIIAERQRLGLSQRDAAAAAQIAQPTWHQWERGTKTVALDTLRRMAAAVGIEVEGPVFVARKKTRRK